MGSGPDAFIRLPGVGIPSFAGEVVVREGKAFLLSQDPGAEGPKLLVNGTFEKEHVLLPTDLVLLGPYRLQLRRSDGAFAVRVANLKGEAMRRYHGLKYFPFDGRFRVPAQFTPATDTREVTVESTRGGPQNLPYAGILSFDLLGKGYSLDAFIDSDEPESLFCPIPLPQNRLPMRVLAGEKTYAAH